MAEDSNSEILTASELTAKAAKKELGKTLDYSMNSFKDLEALIQHVKSHFLKLKMEGKLTEQTVQRASISIGGYLGEVIRRHHGGTWIAKNTVMKVLVISGQEFSPILYVFERLTKDLDYSLEKYLSEVNQKLYFQEKIDKNLPVSETPKKIDTKVIDSKRSYLLSQIGQFLLAGVLVTLLIVGMSSPDYGSTLCGGVILLAVGYAIWILASNNSQRNVTISKAVQKQKQSSYKSSMNPKVDTPMSQSRNKTVACRSCGKVVARTAPVCPSCGDTYPGLIAECPKCGSKGIRILPKGFSLGKSVAGAVIAGPLGILGGLHGRNDLEVTCSSCHNTFTIKNYEI